MYVLLLADEMCTNVVKLSKCRNCMYKVICKLLTHPLGFFFILFLALGGSIAGHLNSSSLGPTLQLSLTEHAYYRVTTTATTNSLTFKYISWSSNLATPQKNLTQLQESILLISGIYMAYLCYV